jgi:crotonobetaine/carnitine-CoA ligase
VKILDDQDREVPVGETGEVCIRPTEPDVIFSGYYRDPAATVAAFRNLWYHSGDLGRIDEDGEFFFVDRKADFMRHKGRNISSFEVESVASRHPAVAEVAAHGVRSDELESEDEIKLCVVLHPGTDMAPAELAGFINANAPYYMVPRYIEFFDELPHTPTGRVQKYQLRARGAGTAAWDRLKTDFVVQR